MKKTFVRLTSALLLAVMLISAVACADTGVENADESTASAQTEAVIADTTAVVTEEETTAVNAENILGLRDLKGEKITFYSRKYNGVWSSDLLVPDADGTILNDAIYKRNSTLTEKYGVEFAQIETGKATFASDLGNRIASGDTSYQVLYNTFASLV